MRHLWDAFAFAGKLEKSSLFSEWCSNNLQGRATRLIMTLGKMRGHRAGRHAEEKKKAMMRNWVHFFGAARRWHRPALWLSSALGLVTILDMDGGIFKTRGFSLLISLTALSIIPLLLSFFSGPSPLPPSFLLPLSSKCLHNLSLLSPVHLPGDPAWGRMSCVCCVWMRHLPWWLSENRFIVDWTTAWLPWLPQPVLGKLLSKCNI